MSLLHIPASAFKQMIENIKAHNLLVIRFRERDESIRLLRLIYKRRVKA